MVKSVYGYQLFYIVQCIVSNVSILNDVYKLGRL